MIVAKFSTLRGGVYIEQREEAKYSPDTRCFRFDATGNVEFAHYGDLTSDNPAPRWYGHIFKTKDFILV